MRFSQRESWSEMEAHSLQTHALLARVLPSILFSISTNTSKWSLITNINGPDDSDSDGDDDDGCVAHLVFWWVPLIFLFSSSSSCSSSSSTSNFNFNCSCTNHLLLLQHCRCRSQESE